MSPRLLADRYIWLDGESFSHTYSISRERRPPDGVDIVNMDRFRLNIILILFFLYPFVVASQLSKFLGAYSASYDKFFHDGLLKQLNIFRQSATTSPSTSTPTGISQADDSTPTFQVYTTDILPTDPSPSDACAAALTAIIACNSTVPRAEVHTLSWSLMTWYPSAPTIAQLLWQIIEPT